MLTSEQEISTLLFKTFKTVMAAKREAFAVERRKEGAGWHASEHKHTFLGTFSLIIHIIDLINEFWFFMIDSL